MTPRKNACSARFFEPRRHPKLAYFRQPESMPSSMRK
jgi:hypothetical protein